MSRPQRRPRGSDGAPPSAAKRTVATNENLLKSGNATAQAALAAFNASGDKDAFQQQIIQACATANAPPAPSKPPSKPIAPPSKPLAAETPAKAANPPTASAGQPRVCSFFARSGQCRKGDKCNFAHIRSSNVGPATQKPTPTIADEGTRTEESSAESVKINQAKKNGPRAAKATRTKSPVNAEPETAPHATTPPSDTFSVDESAAYGAVPIAEPQEAEKGAVLASAASISSVSLESVQHVNAAGSVLELLGLPSDQDARLHDLLGSVGSLSLGFDGFSVGRPPSIPPATSTSPDMNVIGSPKRSPDRLHQNTQRPSHEPPATHHPHPDMPHPPFPPMDMYGMYPPPPPMPYPPMPYPPPYYWPHGPPPMYPPYPYMMPPYGAYGPPPFPPQEQPATSPREEKPEAESNVAPERAPQAPISPPRPQSKMDATDAAAPSAASKLLSMLHVADTVVSPKDKPSDAAAEKVPAKKHRVTKNQPGRISIIPGRDANATTTLHVSPGDSMTVRWELPSEVYSEHRSHLVVSLSRYGSSTNTQNVVEKSLKDAKLSRNDDIVGGDMFFHAPKASGYFCYRIYSTRDEDSKYVTLATSPCYIVDLRGRDVTSNLKFAYEILKKRQVEMNGCMSFKTTVEFMCGAGQVTQKDDPQYLLQKCVQFLFEILSQAIDTLNRKKTLIADEAKSGENNDAMWSSIHMAQRVHIGVQETLSALLHNNAARSLLNDQLEKRVHETLACYCPILHRFFASKEDMEAERIAELHFRPAELQHYSNDSQFVNAFTRSIQLKLPKLLPSADFFPRRYEARQRIQRILVEAGVIPPTTELAIFGSSMNNFGSDGADLDMCLVYYPENSIPMSDRGAVIDRLGDALEIAGMHEVNARGTARIPIVMFHDPVSGLECDISFNNPLALRNTTLLATYSAIDPRVRELAFSIKHWVKRRQMNSPMDGTLGSYGYLLTLIHFLQTRNPPVLPYLQQLPPTWPQGGKTIPHRWEKHPVENCYCDTYFYDGDMPALQEFARRNTQSTGELFAEYVRYMAWECDYAKQVISVRHGTPVLKSDKAEVDCWPMHNRLSVEDPFETWYDVAHVLKNTQMDYLRKEFVRAFTILCNATFKPVNDDRTLTYCVTDAFDKLCEAAELPEFTRSLREASSRSRANTAGSELGGVV